jgi:hypothetical protein
MVWRSDCANTVEVLETCNFKSRVSLESEGQMLHCLAKITNQRCEDPRCRTQTTLATTINVLALT